MRLALDAQTDHARPPARAPRAGGRRRARRATPRQPRRTPRPRSRSSASASARLRERARRRRRRRTPPTPGTCSRSPATSSARASGSSAATAGPTTSASAASTTSCRRAATSTSSCSTPRCTRTPAARPRRRRRAARWPSSRPPARRTGKKDLGAIARAYGNVYVAQVSMGANDAADDQGAARGRRLAGTVAGHRLQHVHRPRHRHVEVDEPPEGRGARAATGRCTASTRARSSDGQPFKLDSHDAVDPGRATSWRPRPASRSSSAPIPSGPPSWPRWPRPTPTSAGATTSSSPGMHRTRPARRSPTRIEPDGRERRGLPLRRRGGPA